MSDHKNNLILVSYLNTIPFIEGFRLHPDHKFNLIYKTPSLGTEMFFNGQSDFALIPIGGLLGRKDYEICTDFCIGCDGPVRTVGVFSDVELDQIKTVYLDSDSRTSVLLVRILFDALGYHDIIWKEGIQHYFESDRSSSGFLAIGDKVFEYENKFPHFIDLGQTWKNTFQLPFAFALFVKKPSISEPDVQELNAILKTGITNIPHLDLQEFSHIGGIQEYYSQNISYHFDDKKKEAVKLFFEKVENLKL